jgi:hypothetical protein
MSEGDRNEFIRHRTEALATVFLTRRPDIQITSFGSGIDLFARIIPSKQDGPVGFFGFGVKLAGTGISLPDEDAANRYGRHLVPNKISGREREYAQYYFPVLTLLFTMDEDRGYYAWVTEPILVPSQGKPHLRRVTNLEFRSVHRATLDEIVERVKSWYKALAKEIFDQ